MPPLTIGENMKIYGYLTFNATKVLLTAVHAKLPFEYQQVDLAKGEQKSPEFTAINPYQKVPALEVDGQSLWESGAICRYLARKAGDRSLYPEEPMAASLVDQWLEFSSCHVTDFCGTLFFESFVAPRFFGKPTDHELVKQASSQLDGAAKILDDQLAKGTYLTGEQLTIGDYVVFAPIHDAVKVATYDMTKFPHLKRWFDAILASDVAKTVFNEYQKMG